MDCKVQPSSRDEKKQHTAKFDWTNVNRPPSNADRIHEESGSHSHRVGFYNDNADVYDEDMICNNYGNYDAKVLDVGGGSGLAITELRKLGAYMNTDGLDPAERLLKIGQEKGLYEKIYPLYFYNGCGVPYDSYDVICCCGALLTGHIKAESLEEMCNVTKTGGLIAIVMGASYLDKDDDLKHMRPSIQKLVSQKTIQVLEDYQFDGYFRGAVGQVFVFRRC